MDETLFRFINGFSEEWPLLDWVMYESSQESNLLIPIVLAVGYWCWANWAEARWAVPCLGLLIGISDFIGGQLKLFFARPRPCHVLSQIHELVGCGGTFSMPSNHAMNSSAAVGFLSILYPPLRWVLWPLMGLIGLSRVYLGAHYVTDVIIGWILGCGLGVATALVLSSRVLRKNPLNTDASE